jgi:hypothetical protein
MHDDIDLVDFIACRRLRQAGEADRSLRNIHKPIFVRHVEMVVVAWIRVEIGPVGVDAHVVSMTGITLA